MKKTLLLIPLLFGVSHAAFASACASATMAVYDASGFTCTLGDLTFSDFQFTSSSFGGALAPDATGVTVSPVTMGFGSETGLLFNTLLVAGGGQLADASVSYDVTTSNAAGITDLELVLVGGAAGGGEATATEVTTAGVPESLFTAVGLGTPITTDSVTFPPQTGLSLTKDFGVSGGLSGGAHLSDVYNLFSEGTTTMTPEPSLAILCVGLLGLVPLARRRFMR